MLVTSLISFSQNVFKSLPAFSLFPKWFSSQSEKYSTICSAPDNFEWHQCCSDENEDESETAY